MCRFVMAQEQGFEPWHPVTGLQAFQACLFNHLSIPAARFHLRLDNNTISSQKNKHFFGGFSDIIRFRDLKSGFSEWSGFKHA